MKQATIEKLFGLYKPIPNLAPDDELKMIHEPCFNAPILDDTDSGEESQ